MNINNRITHPQIHLDYYQWLSNLSEFDANFLLKHAKGENITEKWQNINAIAMYAWSRSRETLKID